MIASVSTRNDDGSSIDVNQKFWCMTSTGFGSPGCHAVFDSRWRYDRPRRSTTIGTHETPASERTIFRSGYRIGILVKIQSTTVMSPLSGNSAVPTSAGECDDGR